MIMGNGVSYYSSPYGSAPFIGLLTNCNQGHPTNQQAVQPAYYNPLYQQQMPTQALLKSEQDTVPAFKLYDFEANNQSDLIRLLFHYAGVAFKDKRIKKDDWLRVKDHIPVQQLPILRVNNQFKVYYLDSIVRYLAREFALYGTSNHEYAMVDMVVHANASFEEKLAKIIDDPSNLEQRKALLSQLITAHSADYLNQLEKFYQVFNREGPFYLGSQISLADLIVYQTINHLIDVEPKLLDNYARLREARLRLEQHPQIVSYLNDPRYSKNKNKRHVTLSPTSKNVYHYYQRYQSHDTRRSSRRHPPAKPTLFVQTKRDPKAFAAPSKEKEMPSPSPSKHESRPASVLKDDKELVPPRAMDVIPQPPPLFATVPPPPKVMDATPQPPLPIRVVDIIPQPPPISEVIPQPPPLPSARLDDKVEPSND